MLQARILPVPCSSSSSQESQILQELLRASSVVQILLKMNIQGEFVFHCFLGSAQRTLSVEMMLESVDEKERGKEGGREGGDTSGALRNLV